MILGLNDYLKVKYSIARIKFVTWEKTGQVKCEKLKPIKLYFNSLLLKSFFDVLR